MVSRSGGGGVSHTSLSSPQSLCPSAWVSSIRPKCAMVGKSGCGSCMDGSTQHLSRLFLDTALPEASSLGTQGFFQRCAQSAAYKAHRTRVSTSWSIQLNVHRRMDHQA